MNVSTVKETVVEYHEIAKMSISEGFKVASEVFEAVKEFKPSEDTATAAFFVGGTVFVLGGGLPLGSAAALTAAVAVNVLPQETVDAVKEGAKWSFIGGVICSGGNPFIGLVSAVASTASTIFGTLLNSSASNGEETPQLERLVKRFTSMIVGNGVGIVLAGFNPSLLVASGANLIYDLVFGTQEKPGSATPIFNM